MKDTQKLLDDYVAGQGKSMTGLGFSREMARKELLRRGDAFQALLELAEAFRSYLEDDSQSPRRTAECYTAACNEILKLANAGAESEGE